MNRNITLQQSSSLHLENTVSQLSIDALKPVNFPHTVRQMVLDPTISGSLSFLRSVMNRPFKIIPHKDSTKPESDLVEALNTSLVTMQPYTMKQLVGNFLDCLTYGYSLNEIVLYRNKKGKYVFKTISPISATTINRFVFDHGTLQKVVLDPADNDGLVEQANHVEQIEIDGSKLLFIRNDASQDFPLGTSLLHGCYQPWKQKQIASEYEIIGIAKRLSGVLQISVPSEHISKFLTDPTSDEALYVEQLLQSADMLHSGKSSHVLLPSDIYSDSGQRQFTVSTIGGDSDSSSGDVGETIERLDRNIQLSLQSVILALGGSGESSGSFALSSNKQTLLTFFVKHIQDTIADAFQKAIRLVFDANGIDTDNLPHVEFEQVEDLDWEAFTKSFATLANAGLITPDVGLEKHVREKLEAPPVKYTERLV